MWIFGAACLGLVGMLMGGLVVNKLPLPSNDSLPFVPVRRSSWRIWNDDLPDQVLLLSTLLYIFAAVSIFFNSILIEDYRINNFFHVTLGSTLVLPPLRAIKCNTVVGLAYIVHTRVRSGWEDSCTGHAQEFPFLELDVSAYVILMSAIHVVGDRLSRISFMKHNYRVKQLDKSGIPAVWTDLKGNVTDWNSGMAKVTGVSLSDAYGKPLSSFMDSTSQGVCDALWSSPEITGSGRTVSGRTVMLSGVPLFVTSSPLWDDWSRMVGREITMADMQLDQHKWHLHGIEDTATTFVQSLHRELDKAQSAHDDNEDSEQSETYRQASELVLSCLAKSLPPNLFGRVMMGSMASGPRKTSGTNNGNGDLLMPLMSSLSADVNGDVPKVPEALTNPSGNVSSMSRDGDSTAPLRSLLASFHCSLVQSQNSSVQPSLAPSGSQTPIFLRLAIGNPSGTRTPANPGAGAGAGADAGYFATRQQEIEYGQHQNILRMELPLGNDHRHHSDTHPELNVGSDALISEVFGAMGVNSKGVGCAIDGDGGGVGPADVTNLPTEYSPMHVVTSTPKHANGSDGNANNRIQDSRSTNKLNRFLSKAPPLLQLDQPDAVPQEVDHVVDLLHDILPPLQTTSAASTTASWQLIPEARQQQPDVELVTAGGLTPAPDSTFLQLASICDCSVVREEVIDEADTTDRRDGAAATDDNSGGGGEGDVVSSGNAPKYRNKLWLDPVLS